MCCFGTIFSAIYGEFIVIIMQIFDFTHKTAKSVVLQNMIQQSCKVTWIASENQGYNEYNNRFHCRVAWKQGSAPMYWFLSLLQSLKLVQLQKENCSYYHDFQSWMHNNIPDLGWGIISLNWYSYLAWLTAWKTSASVLMKTRANITKWVLNFPSLKRKKCTN